MRRKQTGPLVWFQFASLVELAPLVTHGVFSRHGGVSEAPYASLNAGHQTADDPARVAGALPGEPLLVGCVPDQRSDVREVTTGDLEGARGPAYVIPARCDALITEVHGIALFWAVADCSVVLIVDAAHEAIGLVHAGWRGTSLGIVSNTLRAMGERYGTRPEQCVTAIAPTIGPCCYEVDQPVYDAFQSLPFAGASARFSTVRVADAAGTERDSLRLDLSASNHAQLAACGVSLERIESAEQCTGSHTDLYFSHRVEGSPSGRFAVALGLL